MNPKQNPKADQDENPTKALLKIVHGDTKDLHIPNKSIVTGKKIKNSIMRKFVGKYKETSALTPEQLIDVVLAFDEVVEKELLTDDILEQIRRDPSVLDKYLNKSKK